MSIPSGSDYGIGLTDPYPTAEDYPLETIAQEMRDSAGHGSRALEQAPPEAKVNLDVPVVHQLWDTSDDFDGHWACGPTSATMTLAYYGLIQPHPITVHQPWAHESPYGWYVSNECEIGGKVWSNRSRCPSGSFAGVYGALVGNHNGN